MSTIQAIETRYKGYRFRSRLEARWAVFFDALGVKWEYEKEGYELPSGRYLPDFWLPEQNRWVEIKPNEPLPEIKIYIAGKVGGWRNVIRLRGHRLVGPFTEGHGRGHGEPGEAGEIIGECLEGIRAAKAFAMWVDSADCYGSLFEAGYWHCKRAAGIGSDPSEPASAFGISTRAFEELANKAAADSGYDRCHLRSLGREHDMWFAESFFGTTLITDDPQDVVDALLPQYTEEETKCQELAEATKARVTLLGGSPHFERPRGFDFSAIEFNPYGVLSRSFDCWPSIYSGHRANLFEALERASSARFEYGESG